MTIRIMGIDPGSRFLGWAVLEDSVTGFELLGSGVISARASTPFHSRVHKICTSLIEKIELFTPSEASIEEVFINKNPRSSINLVQLRGALLYVVQNYKMSIYEYSPTFVKKSITGNGLSSKKFLSAILCAQGTKCNSYDESDAVALALCHKYNKTEA